jgi:DNA-directed RNA polymerase subunit RPC12/RpoP
MTVNTECYICGGEAIGIFKTHKTHKPVFMCAECSRSVLAMTRERNKPKEVATNNIW